MMGLSALTASWGGAFDGVARLPINGTFNLRRHRLDAPAGSNEHQPPMFSRYWTAAKNLVQEKDA